MTIEQSKLDALLGTMVTEIGATANAALVLLGDRLGLYKTLSSAGEMTAAELAEATSTKERYIREWLSAQAASGFITYEPETKKFHLSPEQSAVFADEDSPVNMTGGFYSLAAVFAGTDQLANAFKNGSGIGWGDQCNCLFCGTERFFKPGYQANLISAWLPALDGVYEKLTHGARVADVGCGHGASTFIMAEAFDRSTFTGFDYHEPSIATARNKINGSQNISFETASAKNFSGQNYDLVTIFDALHDMGDPVGIARYIHSKLAKDGTLMIVEPMAADTLEDNLNPVGRVYYAFSTAICVPTSLSQEVGAALGAQAGEARLTDVLNQAGFTKVRRATETPFNMVLEARP